MTKHLYRANDLLRRSIDSINPNEKKPHHSKSAIPRTKRYREEDPPSCGGSHDE